MQKGYFFILIFIGVGCATSEYIKNNYIGNFREHNFQFMESFEHVTDTLYYSQLPFERKYFGVAKFSTYQWLRNPKNLETAYYTMKWVGLNEFISVKEYHSNNNDFCCNNDWKNKSLDDIVKGFIASDTINSTDKYYKEFWNRRRNEKNLSTFYKILLELNGIYNGKELKYEDGPIDETLAQFLTYDFKLMKADSNEYNAVAKKYANYLSSVGLHYSAYKLIFHNSRFVEEEKFQNDLLINLPHDTLSKNEWNLLDDNYEGWIHLGYSDPIRYYGP
jgi:hypothetical protein